MHLEKTNPLPKSHYLPDYLANNKRFKNLQISIVNKSDVDKVKRFDAEYLEIEKKLAQHNHLIQKHDLKLIAKIFTEWAKKQKLNRKIQNEKN